MVISTYKGDSPGKKLQRLRTWFHLYKLGQVCGAPYEGSLVLAGDGGDVGVLRAMGVPAPTITAVDLDRDRVAVCRNRFPRISTLCCDVGSASRHLPYSMAHIDFCGRLGVANIRTLVEVARNFTSHPGVLAVTMLKGREKRDRVGLLDHISEEHRELWRKQKGKIDVYDRISTRLLDRRFDARPLIQMAEEDLRVRGDWLDYADKARARQMVLEEALFTTLLLEGTPRLVSSAGVMEYHSRSESAWGTPFWTAHFIIAPMTMKKWLDEVREQASLHIYARDAMPLSECMAALPPTAVALAETFGVERTALALGVEPRTIIAWKAHHTRGSYEQKPVMCSAEVEHHLTPSQYERAILDFMEIQRGYPLGRTLVYQESFPPPPMPGTALDLFGEK